MQSNVTIAKCNRMAPLRSAIEWHHCEVVNVNLALLSKVESLNVGAVRGRARMRNTTLITIIPSNDVIAKVELRGLYLLDRYLYLPSNGTIVIVVFRDRDVDFQGQNFEMLITRKR